MNYVHSITLKIVDETLELHPRMVIFSRPHEAVQVVHHGFVLTVSGVATHRVTLSREVVTGSATVAGVFHRDDGLDRLDAVSEKVDYLEIFSAFDATSVSHLVKLHAEHLLDFMVNIRTHIASPAFTQQE